MKKQTKKLLIWSAIIVLSPFCLYYGLIIGTNIYQNSLPLNAKYYIPEGYIGWIVINYIMEDYPDILTDQDGVQIIKIPPTGVYKTSYNPTVERRDGRYGTEYYFYSTSGEKPIPLELIDWRGSVGRSDENGKHYEFRTRLWVGTQEQYAKYGMGQYSNPQPGPIFPLVK